MKTLDIRLEAVVDDEKETSRFTKIYTTGKVFTDYQEMLDCIHPELVLVFPSDDNKQFELTKACLLAGADVLCERPVCHTLTEGEELCELQNKTGHFIMPRYNRRYMPVYNSAKHIIKSLEFGKTYMYNSSFHAGAYASEQKLIYNHISHHLDLARMLLGQIELLYVRRIAEDKNRMGFNIVFENQEGALGNIQSNSFLCGDYPMERLEISGNYRQIIVENVRHLCYNQPPVYLTDTDKIFVDESGTIDFLSSGGTKILNMNYAQLNNYTFYGFEGMLREFVISAERKTMPCQNMKDVLQTYNLIQSLDDMVKSQK
jgi:predicted dehydrogenase